jgi:hypothetical protein
MADINIERKERNVWPWIVVGLIVLALIIWWVAIRPAPRTEAVVGPPDTAAVVTPPGPATTNAVADFVRFSDEGRAAGEVGITHDYTADGIRRLAAALEEVARQQPTREAEVAARIPLLRNHADSLQADPESQRHANHVRTAFMTGADILEALRRGDPGAEGAVRSARQAAESIRGTTPLLQQRRQVRTYFERAADALRAVGPRTS